MNSQLSEQLNNSLRKLATVAGYSKVDTYIKFLEVFITVRNLSKKLFKLEILVSIALDVKGLQVL